MKTSYLHQQTKKQYPRRSKKRVHMFAFIKIEIQLVFINKKCIFAPLINGGRVPQNLITRLCQ
jgi:hypothetical protein